VRVRVYWNLHRKEWSIQTHTKGKGWRVFAHGSSVWLKDVTFKVSEAGRQRVISQRRKNVHAYAIGELAGVCDPFLKDGTYWPDAPGNAGWPDHSYNRTAEAVWRSVAYNPYNGPNFMLSGRPVFNLAEVVMLETREVFGTKKRESIFDFLAK
jgi:hypothetical protein